MNILFVSALLPFPLHSGGQIRVYQLLKRLSKRHSITLFSYLRTVEENKYISELSFCDEIHTTYRGRVWQPRYIIPSILSNTPLLMSSYSQIELRNKITQAMSRKTYNLIHLEPWYVSKSLPKTTIPIVLVEHNIEYMIYREYTNQFQFPILRPFLFSDVNKLVRQEREAWKESRCVVAVSEEDASIVRKDIPHDRVRVVPNGVDTNSYVVRPTYTNVESPIVLFIGNFAWLQNRDAVNYLLTDVWPQLHNRLPKSQLHIVGRSPSSSIINKAKRYNVIVKANVSDIRTEFQKAHMLLAPIRIGGGTKYKILESMASGVPVITTTAGAVGLDVQHDRELIIANTASEMISSVIKLIHNKRYRETLIRKARQKVETSYGWETIADQMNAVWESV